MNPSLKTEVYLCDQLEGAAMATTAFAMPPIRDTCDFGRERHGADQPI